MFNKMYFNFGIFYSLIFVIAGLASYSVYVAYSASGTGSVFLFYILFIGSVIFIVTTAIGLKYNNVIINFLYIISSIILPLLFYLFCSSIILKLLFVIGGNNFGATIFYKIVAYILLATSLLLVIYGLFQTENFKNKKYIIPKTNRLNKHLQGHKIVLFADPHIGMVHGKRYLNKIVKFVMAQKPDIIILAGDLVDGPKINIEKILAPVKQLSAPKGIYYTTGNHEMYLKENKKLYEYLDKIFTNLQDKKTTINGVDIIGLNYDANESDYSTLSRLDKAGFQKIENDQKSIGTPSIVIMHDPSHNTALMHEGADLVLSAHTHAGQFWPFNLCSQKIYKEYSYGLISKDYKLSITTSGIGTWGAPIRIATHSEIVTIEFE